MVNFDPDGLMFSDLNRVYGCLSFNQKICNFGWKTSEEKVSFVENTNFPQNHFLQKSTVFRVLTDSTKN